MKSLAIYNTIFSERNCIITNSKTGTKTIEKTTDEQEKLLNSLEDKNNHITAIFTVKRLKKVGMFLTYLNYKNV